MNFKRTILLLSGVVILTGVNYEDARAGSYPWVLCTSAGAVGSAAAGDHVSVVKPSAAVAAPCGANNNHLDSVGPRNDFNVFTRIAAPAGTRILGLNVDAVGHNYAYNRGWGYAAYSPSTSSSFFCSFYENQFPDSTCKDGSFGFSTHGPKALALPFGGTDAIYFGIYCRDLTGCRVGTLDLETKYLSVDVRDETRPSVELGGDAWTSASLSGTPTLTYRASDNASGTQGITAEIDGVVKADTASRDSTGCDDTRWHRCPDDAGSTPVSLVNVADGPHILSVSVSDAAGNASTPRTRSIVVDNQSPSVAGVSIGGDASEGSALTCAASVSGQSPHIGYKWLRAEPDGSGAQEIGGATGSTYTLSLTDVGKKVLCRLTATDGGGTAVRTSTVTSGPFAAGATVAARAGSAGPAGTQGASGAPGAAGSDAKPASVAGGSSTAAARNAAANAAACSAATVKLTTATRETRRPYLRSRVTVAGRLLDGSGQPKGGQALDLMQTVRRAGTVRRGKVASGRTGTDGAFRVTAPRGPTRSLQLVVPGCGSVGPILTQRVRGAVQAKTMTPKVRNRQTAQITGRVVGGQLGRGIPLELQVKVGAKWQDVKHVMSDAKGAFRVSYRFMRTFVRYTYEFRVVTRAASGWPYMPGKSRIVRVRVN